MTAGVNKLFPDCVVIDSAITPDPTVGSVVMDLDQSVALVAVLEYTVTQDPVEVSMLNRV
jgi:hypothetical protein